MALLSAMSPPLTRSYSREYISRRYWLGAYGKGGDIMALCNVMFLCSDCGRFHATKLSVTVIDGPGRRKQIDEVYSPLATPAEVTELLRRDVMCPVTRNSIKLDRKKF